MRTLELIRYKRGFNPVDYIKAKCSLLNEYMEANQLNACVIGISGGIDSALALSLIVRAAQQKDSPIQEIFPLALPIHTRGATNQEAATQRALSLCLKLRIQLQLIDLTQAAKSIELSFAGINDLRTDGWSEGQLASYIRTPALYYATSLLYQKNLPAIVIGTTNRDEGAYLGFYGKASDAMVDIQLISDLHKSEIIKVAQLLDVPESILKSIPSGDMYDGRTDQEVFGTSYDFVELYLSLLSVRPQEKKHLTSHWNQADINQYTLFSERLDKLHQHNAHKYQVNSPALHLDILESEVPGGWKHQNRS